MECFHFSEQSFHAIVLTKFSLSLFNILSCPYLTTTISISNDSLTSLTQYLFLMERVLGIACRSVHGVLLCVWLLQRITSQLPFMVSCCFSIDLLVILFFVSPLYTDPHEHFNSYTPGQLFGINLPLFLHQIFFKLGPV